MPLHELSLTETCLFNDNAIMQFRRSNSPMHTLFCTMKASWLDALPNANNVIDGKLSLINVPQLISHLQTVKHGLPHKTAINYPN